MAAPREFTLPERLAERDEEEWERLRVLLDYSTGFWLAFVFSPSSLDAHVFRHRVKKSLEAEGAGRMDVFLPQSPEELRQALPWLLSEERADAACVWVQALQVDPSGRDEQPWTDAWAHVFLRTNERRDGLRRRLRGGLVFVAPPSIKVIVREAAPDLWSVRTIVVELSGKTAANQGALDLVAREMRPIAEHRTTTTAPDPVFWIEEANRREPGSEGRALALFQAALGWLNEERFVEALPVASEAVDIYRRLAEQLPDAFRSGLAASLNNLGNVQGKLGQHHAALASTQEAVDIRRKLVEHSPDAYLPRLAGSLHNLGIRQSALDRHEALASTQEAVDIRRRLAEHNPDAYLPDLATSLNNLGAVQFEVGQHEAALASTQEAVAMYRQLSEQRPTTFLPGMARALRNLGIWQGVMGQGEAAVATAREAFKLYRGLSEQDPQRFKADVKGAAKLLRALHDALGIPLDPATAERIAAFEANEHGGD